MAVLKMEKKMEKPENPFPTQHTYTCRYSKIQYTKLCLVTKIFLKAVLGTGQLCFTALMTLQPLSNAGKTHLKQTTQ